MTKLYETLRARAALAGVTLHSSRDTLGKDLFVASRWNVMRTFASLSEVEAWLDVVTGGSRGDGHA